MIVLGMHRSGTSLLTQILHEAGFFIGRRWDHLFESTYMRRLNRSVLERAGVPWYDPAPLQQRLADASFRADCRAWLEAQLEATFLPRFLGWPGRLAAARPSWRWTWKDPRTVLLADVWSDIFPGARFVHIVRHPLDVAISLQRREEQRTREGRPAAPSVLELEHNLRLWEEYVGQCVAQRRRAEAYHEMRFEDLTAQPAAELERLNAAMCLALPPARMARAAALADASRTRRFEEERYRPWRARAADMPLAREFGYD